MTAPDDWHGPIARKVCARCCTLKTIEMFHHAARGLFRRHSYCKLCVNTYARGSRRRSYTPGQKRKWQLKTRYGLAEADVDAMVEKQGGCCALCPADLKKFHVDHCHNTGAVRGLLCHRCNIRLGGWDDIEWRAKAIKYLKLDEESVQ